MPQRDKDVVKTLNDDFITNEKLKQLVLYQTKPDHLAGFFVTLLAL